MKLIRYAYPSSSAALNRFFDIGAPRIEQLSSLFDDFFSGDLARSEVGVNLYEDTHNYYVKLELPGLNKESIDIDLENSVLTIRQTVAEKSDHSEANTRCVRTLKIPDGVDVDKVGASHVDGVLTVTLPKEIARQPRQIEVK